MAWSNIVVHIVRVDPTSKLILMPDPASTTSPFLSFDVSGHLCRVGLSLVVFEKAVPKDSLPSLSRTLRHLSSQPLSNAAMCFPDRFFVDSTVELVRCPEIRLWWSDDA